MKDLSRRIARLALPADHSLIRHTCHDGDQVFFIVRPIVRVLSWIQQRFPWINDWLLILDDQLLRAVWAVRGITAPCVDRTVAVGDRAYRFVRLGPQDGERLARFFAHDLPPLAHRLIPHRLDRAGIDRVLQCKCIIAIGMFAVGAELAPVAYGLVRPTPIGLALTAYAVSPQHRRFGTAKYMARCLQQVVFAIRQRVFSTMDARNRAAVITMRQIGVTLTPVSGNLLLVTTNEPSGFDLEDPPVSRVNRRWDVAKGAESP